MVYLIKFSYFATIVTKSKNKIIITHNQECKKITKGYLHLYVIKTIFAFLNRYETFLFIPSTISCNFQICKHI